jgi:hypothetical protein
MLIEVLTNVASKQNTALIVIKYLALDMSTRAADNTEVKIFTLNKYNLFIFLNLSGFLKLENLYSLTPIVQFSLFNSAELSNKGLYQEIVFKGVHSSLSQFRELLESSEGLYEPTKLLRMISRQLDLIMLIIKYMLSSVTKSEEATLPIMLLYMFYKFMEYFFQCVSSFIFFRLIAY